MQCLHGREGDTSLGFAYGGRIEAVTHQLLTVADGLRRAATVLDIDGMNTIGVDDRHEGVGR